MLTRNLSNYLHIYLTLIQKINTYPNIAPHDQGHPIKKRLNSIKDVASVRHGMNARRNTLPHTCFNADQDPNQPELEL
uniref:Uncharacterized protein n=1 Tax=Schistosoma curassoni TaxID=6186 RepID=A0A183K0K3_9TREM